MTPRSRKTPSKNEADLIVVGGGLAGLTLTALLASQEVSVVCVDREAPAKTGTAEFDLRTTAISYGSQLVLRAAGVWDLMGDHPCPIKDIQVRDTGSPVLLNFLANDLEGEPFGWIVNNLDLRRALQQRVASLKSARHLAPATVRGFSVKKEYAEVALADGMRLRAPLVIGADGKKSSVREFLGIPLHGWMYNQTAIVCVVAHENPHHNRAIEHFRPEGPFAILPMSDRADGRHCSALVWSVEGRHVAPMSWDEATFNLALAARFPPEYGNVALLGPRAAWPLGLQHAHAYIGPRMALVAEAAHAMHPIAGQGLNMGLRDIAELAELLAAARRDGRDPGSPDILRTYQQRRHFDNMAMMAATDALTRVFSNRLPVIGGLRRLGVSLVQACPPVRRFFMKQAMGTAGFAPALMKRKTGSRERV